MTVRPPPATPLPRQVQAWLLGTLALVLAAHAPHLPWWITLGGLAGGAWCWFANRRWLRLPPRSLSFALTLTAVGGVYLSYGELLGQEAGTAMLIAMTVLKLLELRHRRDAVLLVGLGFFLVATQFLRSQELLMLFYLGLCTLGLIVCLMGVTRESPPPRPLTHLRQAGVIMLQALPVMALLFFLFPRLDSPLWSMPDDGPAAITGLSDHMEPGSIGNLARSDAVAMRVEMAGTPPPGEQRYWRGPVFEAYDGRRWRGDRDLHPAPEPVSPAPGAESRRQTITLEAHDRKWLLGLDVPMDMGMDNARLLGARQWELDRRVRSRLRYQVESTLDYRLGDRLTRAQRSANLHLPEGVHPRARAMVEQWRELSEEPGDLLDQAIDHFRGQDFGYTLSPPVMHTDMVDEFLFEHRQGFCEHYAGAFAVMMRAAGVPARVVTGYLGGEMNRVGDYLIVRQSDAHAWNEVWLEDQGWVRVDPTALAAPDRLDSGLDGSVSDPETMTRRRQAESSWLRALQMRWDAVNMTWHRWMLGYDPDTQKQWLKRLGLISWQHAVFALGIAMVLVSVLLAWITISGGAPRSADPAARAWQRLAGKLAGHGLPPMTGETPSAYARRTAHARPELADEITRIARLYQQYRYEPAPDAETLRELQRRIRQLRL